MKNSPSMNTDVMHLDLPEHTPVPSDDHGPRTSLALLNDIKVSIDICLGTKELTVRELLSLKSGAVLELDRQLQQDVDVILNDKVIARGQIVAVGENFGLRITDIPSQP